MPMPFRGAACATCAAALVLLDGCLAEASRKDLDAIERAAASPTVTHSTAHDENVASDDEAALAKAADPSTILRVALAHNPDLAQARERVLAAAARARSIAHLPDPELKYEQWAVPLARPWALDEAQTIMVGLRQSFPAPGSLDAKTRVAVEEAQEGVAAIRARQLDIAQQVRHALAEYWRADREYRVHLEHVAIAEHLVELARAGYRAGRGSQQDVLRAIVEVSRLHTDVADIEQQRRSQVALLNALMARPPEAPLGPAPEPTPVEIETRFAELSRRLDAARPELAAADHAVKRSEAQVAAARQSAYWPSFMVGADYWFMPTATTPMPQHAYSGMVSLTLPWLNPQHRDELRAAEHALAADRHALAAARNAAHYQLADALARAVAAREALAVYDRDLLGQARESYESAEATYAAGQGDALGLLDALRGLLQVRLDRLRALARLEGSLADLDRAVGEDGSRR